MILSNYRIGKPRAQSERGSMRMETETTHRVKLVGRALDWLQWLVGALVLVLFFRGQEGHRELLASALCVPLVRFAASTSFRQRVLNWLRDLWRDIEDFPVHGRIPWKSTGVLVVLPAGIFYLISTCNLMSGDSWPVMPTSFGLVTRGHWKIDELVSAAPAGYRTNPEELPYYTLRRETGIYSAYPSGLVPFAIPVAEAARLAGADFHQAPVLGRLEKWTAAWITAGSLGFFFLIALHLVQAREAWAITVLLAIGSVMCSTAAQGLWSQDGLIFWSLFILLIEFRRMKKPMQAGTVFQGIACAQMLACRLTAVAFLVPFGAWMMLRSPKRALALMAIALVAFLPWGWEYWSIYGNILGPSMQLTAGMNWTLNVTEGLAGVLISPGRGLLVYQPWLLLGAAVLFPTVRSKLATARPSLEPSGWELLCLTVIFLQLALIGAWRYWWGGYCWGSRLAAEIIPLAALLCLRPMVGLWRSSIGRPAVLCAALASILIHFAAVFGHAADWSGWTDIDHHPAELWSWSHPPFLFPLQSHKNH